MGQSASTNSVEKAPQEGPQASDGCPVMHKQVDQQPEQAAQSGCPVMHKNSNTVEGGCPVKYKNEKQYNVYSQEINPLNQMPANPNQLPGPDQTKPIDTTRVKSSIPKGGTDDSTWTYPSPQMFYNSLKVIFVDLALTTSQTLELIPRVCTPF